jgi:hypothetical protein
MNFLPSRANESDISCYTEGSCHDFACAVHEYTGWPLLLVYDKAYPSTPSEDGPIKCVQHVACVDPDGNVWDATGRVGRRSVGQHLRKYMHFKKVGTEVTDLDGLDRYVGDTLPEQYPFTMAWADRDARRILRDFNILPAPMAFTDTSATLPASPGFAEDHAIGLPSLNLAVGIGTHFGYPVMVAFDSDGELVRAWAQDFDGRPVTSFGLLDGEHELVLPEACTVTRWDKPHHALADERLRGSLGGARLNVESVMNAFELAQRAFRSVKDDRVDGKFLTSYYLRGEVEELLVEAKYNDEFGGLTEMAANAKPHSVSAGSGVVAAL